MDPSKLERVAERIAAEDHPVHPDEFILEAGLSKRKLASALHHLENAGAVETLPTGEVRIEDEADLSEAVKAAAQEQQRRSEMKKQRLDQMGAYAESSGCRREILLRYFGDEFTGPYDNCDVCEAAKPGLVIEPSAGTRREVVA